MLRILLKEQQVEIPDELNADIAAAETYYQHHNSINIAWAAAAYDRINHWLDLYQQRETHNQVLAFWLISECLRQGTNLPVIKMSPWDPRTTSPTLIWARTTAVAAYDNWADASDWLWRETLISYLEEDAAEEIASARAALTAAHGEGRQWIRPPASPAEETLRRMLGVRGSTAMVELADEFDARVLKTRAADEVSLIAPAA